MSLPELPFPYGRLQFRPIDRVGGTSRIVLTGEVRGATLQRFQAHVKLLPPREFVAESICAWLAKEVGLPAPDAWWVAVSRSCYQAGWPFGADDVHLCFGTTSLRSAQPLRLTSSVSAGLLQRGHVLLLAQIALFDELIGNDDRHQGNLLLGPTGDVFLIDHERALGSSGTALFSTDQMGPNHLLEATRLLVAKQRVALLHPLLSFATACRVAVDRLPLDQIIEGDAALRAAAKLYLTKRAAGLHDVVHHTLGLPDLVGFSDDQFRSASL